MNKVFAALKRALPDAKSSALNEQSRFEDVPGWDSMSSVSFLIELESEVGGRLSDLPLAGEMTIREFSELLREKGIAVE